MSSQTVQKQGAESSIYQERMVGALIRGDESIVRNVIDEALRARTSARQIYLDIVLPAQRRLGDLWVSGQISVAEEHRATQITLSQLARLRELLKPALPIGRTIIITAVEGDPHTVGGRIVSDLLYLDGWTVHYLGADTPTRELVQFVKRYSSDIVGLSITLPSSIPAAISATKALRAEFPTLKIIIGGIALQDEKEALQIKADGISKSPADAVAIARQVLGLPPPTGSLDQYLKELGQRIQSLRKEKQLSQSQVAEASGLDRAYISALENGKHNVTVGAVMRLAQALDIPFEQLLIN